MHRFRRKNSKNNNAKAIINVNSQKLPSPSNCSIVTPINYNMDLLQDTLKEIKNNPTNYSREPFIEKIKKGYYNDVTVEELVKDLEEYNLIPLIFMAYFGRYNVKNISI